MRSIMGLTLAIAIGGLATAEDKPADAAKKLEGTYSVVEFLTNGKPSPKTAEIKTVEIKDGVISINLDKKSEDANFTLDPSKKPRAADWTITTEGDLKGKTALGIYDLDKDTWKHCFGFDKRPEKFESKEGSKVTNAVLKRVKK